MRSLVGNHTDLVLSEPDFLSVISYANSLKKRQDEGYSIALLVSMSILERVKPKISIPEHWIGLGDIEVLETSKTIKIKVFTWGSYGHIYYWNRPLEISFDIFIDTIFGYIAGK